MFTILTMHEILGVIIFYSSLTPTLQSCPEEYSQNGIRVKWNQTPTAFNVESNPLCYLNDDLVKRNCSGDKWTPDINEVGPCLKVVKTLNSTSCPPNFHKITESNNEYCYHIRPRANWDYPCLSSGGASVITDLNEQETNTLLDSLVAQNMSRYFWLPAHRVKIFHPVVWSIPGPNWGVQVETNDHLNYHNLIWKNCLVLDVQLRMLTTDICTQLYPSLCFYINNIHYPAICPKGYHAFRYRPDNGTCYGIEKSESETGLTFENFRQIKCKNPISYKKIASNIFIFTKIAERTNLQKNEWCWFKASFSDFEENNSDFPNQFKELEGVINNIGTLGLINSSSTLSCMACEAEVIYGETELMFEYNEVTKKIYLTIYFPSGLWKYDDNDKGIRCFSDAKGIVTLVNINDLPFFSVSSVIEEEGSNIEKIVYVVDLITQRSAQYWCEGHTFNFSLISTNKLVVNPKGKEIHVFAMTIKYYNFDFEIDDISRIDTMLSYLAEMFGAQQVLWMDVYKLSIDYITILLHVHATVINEYEDEVLNIQKTYDNIVEIALQKLPTVNCSFVNLTSSLYCLPTTSNDSIILDWEMTPIGHISAPKQFCLQSNGLPVKRQCLGSYHSGATWGMVEGRCDSNYTPTITTTFLYNIVKGHAPSNYTSSFLTDGLEFVLSDVDIIIPADIYYLSMSLQQVLHVAQENHTSVDIGDIDNIAWVMDRVMEFDWDYLRLAQTLNSTNVILNSVNDIIEMIATQSLNETDVVSNKTDTAIATAEIYQLAIKPQFIVQISYPTLTNVTGIAITKTLDTDEFTNMIVKPLYANTTLNEVLEMENLEIAAWLPLNLVNTLRPNSNETLDQPITRNNVHVIISVFQNDAVFQELVTTDHIINSRIVGVSIPGFISNLENPIPIVFRHLNHSKNEKLCGFWDFNMQKSTLMSGFWKTQGCFPVKSRENVTVCECYHLTHFSQLITIPTSSDKIENPNVKQHTKALNIITLVGCFLSLVGIIGIWTTALVFANWRRKAGTKILLQLSTAISLPLMFIVIFNLDNTIFIHENGNYAVAQNMKPLCIILGSLLHYSILSSFMWMLITAILQFIRYVRVLGVNRPSRFMFKFSIVGWGFPILPVIIVLSLDVESYIPDVSQCKRLCYPKGIYFIFSVMLPICIILFINVVLFLLVLHSISRGSNEKMKSTDYDLVGAQLRLSIFLFFLLGLTWIFGIFSFTTNMLWSYLFCLTSTLQGFVFFIYFIVCDPTTRNMWITLVKPQFTPNSSRNSITSFS